MFRDLSAASYKFRLTTPLFLFKQTSFLELIQVANEDLLVFAAASSPSCY